MATNPITVVQQLRMANGGIGDNVANPTQSYAQTNPRFHRPGVAVPTTAGGTAIAYGNVTAPGWCQVENQDPTNYIEVGLVVSGTFYPFCKVNPGDCSGPIYMADSVQWYWRAYTAVCEANILILDR